MTVLVDGADAAAAALITADGLTLHLRRWLCTRPRGTVLLVHGLGEHGGRYGREASALNDWGWNVIAHDHRGHGLSGGARGRICRDDALLSDLALVMDSTRAQH